MSHVLRARGFSPTTAALRANIPIETLDVGDDQEIELSDEELTSLAQELAVPVRVLFARNAPPLFPTVDFRSAKPRVRAPKKGTLSAIALVERLSSTFADIEVDVSSASDAIADGGSLSLSEARALAKVWRKRWRLGIEQQLEFRNPSRLYESLRAFVEGLGVMVIHYSFGHRDTAGLYAQVENGPHTIVINTTGSSKARKCFTLAHEFCHFLIRQEGASNPSVLLNDVERFCNRFAAHLLAPDALINRGLKEYRRPASVDNDFVRLFAARLSISQEALVRRMVEMGLVSRADYSAWRSQFADRVPPGDLSDGGGSATDPLQTKRTIYGSTLLRLLREAHGRGDLDEIEIYRLCGLKPKYQRPLFAAEA